MTEIRHITERFGFQVRYIASPDIRNRAWLACEKQSSYIITRQFYSVTAQRWVTEPLSY